MINHFIASKLAPFEPFMAIFEYFGKEPRTQPLKHLKAGHHRACQRGMVFRCQADGGPTLYAGSDERRQNFVQ